jgi:hypothetical protein
MRRIFVVVVVAGVSLAGCGLAVANCDGRGACKVDVSVTNCVITPDPASLPVTGKNINIFWELDALSMFYRFPDDGVKLKTSSPEFDEPEAQANRKKFKLHDKNSLAGQHTYPYTIKVQRLVLFQWVDCSPLDPTIVNQG